MKLTKLSIIVYLSIVVSYSVRAATNTYRHVRSVETCLPPASGPEQSCMFRCDKAVLTDRYMKQLNVKVFQAVDRNKLGHHVCCCRYDKPWPLEVDPKSYGVNNIFYARAKCLPLGSSIMLSRRTREAFQEVCSTLATRQTLTVLETLKFAKSIAYLNYVKPRNPSILLLSRHKFFKCLTRDIVNGFQSKMYLLLDNEDQFDQSFPLSIDQIRKFIGMQRVDFADARKCEVLRDTVDEFMISWLVRSILRAYDYVIQIHSELGLLDHFDAKDDYIEVRIPPNCDKLAKFKSDLGAYLKILETFDSIFYDIKLVFNTIKQHSPQIKGMMERLLYYNERYQRRCINQKGNKRT